MKQNGFKKVPMPLPLVMAEGPGWSVVALLGSLAETGVTTHRLELFTSVRRFADGSIAVGRRMLPPPCEPGTPTIGASGGGGGGAGGSHGATPRVPHHPPARGWYPAIGTNVPGLPIVISNPRYWGGDAKDRHDAAMTLKPVWRDGRKDFDLVAGEHARPQPVAEKSGKKKKRRGKGGEQNEPENGSPRQKRSRKSRSEE